MKTMFNGWEFWLLLSLSILAGSLPLLMKLIPKFLWIFGGLLAGAVVVGVVFVVSGTKLPTLHFYTYFLGLAGIVPVALIRLRERTKVKA